MTKFLANVLILIMLLISNLIWAAPLTKTQLDELFEVLRVKEFSVFVYKDAEIKLRKLVEQEVNKSNNLKQEQFDLVVNKVVQALKQEVEIDQLTNKYSEAYIKSFEAEEIEYLISFYQSKAGQSLLNANEKAYKSADVSSIFMEHDKYLVAIKYTALSIQVLQSIAESIDKNIANMIQQELNEIK